MHTSSPSFHELLDNPLTDFEWLEETFREVLAGRRLQWRSGRGRPNTQPMSDVLMARTLRTLRGTQALEEHFTDATGKTFAGSCCSRRIRQLDYETLQIINNAVLLPLASEPGPGAAVWKNWRLTGIDGTTFNLQNTAQIHRRVPKSRTGGKNPEQGEVCFPRINACALVELDSHAPLAAEVALGGEGGITLARRLVPRIEKGMLVFGDQLYGCGAFVQVLYHHCREVGAAFAVKVLPEQGSRHVETLPDSSRLVEVDVRSQKRPADIAETILLREITYTVETTDENGRRGQTTYRLWTNLPDTDEYPARELAGQTGSRWEHELYYKELKSLMPHEYLDSQMLETAVVEIMSMLWVSALSARVRRKCARESSSSEAVPPVRISYSKTREALEKLLWLLHNGADVLTRDQKEAFVGRTLARLRQRTVPPRRNRACPRKVRRKQKHWPKIRDRADWPSDVEIKVVPE